MRGVFGAPKRFTEHIFAKSSGEGGLIPRFVDKLTEIITSDKKVWVEFMMPKELGIILGENVSLWRGALATFFAFVAAGFMPFLFFALSYAFDITNTFTLSVVTTLVSLFILGGLRVIVTRRNWLKSGFEVLLAGGAAAAVAYIIGYLLTVLVG